MECNAECSSIAVDTHTDRQTKYCNPRSVRINDTVPTFLHAMLVDDIL